MKVGVILAAGNSTRFQNEVPKQLFPINGKPLIAHSVEALSILDHTFIVTNTICSEQISKIAPSCSILINDAEDRKRSIRTALDYIDQSGMPVEWIAIHDAARPFITIEHIQKLLDQSGYYSLYCLKQVNGLLTRNEQGHYAVADRDKFLELCTPQLASYKLYNGFFRNFIDRPNSDTPELLTLVDMFNIEHTIIYGSARYLRKITTPDDI